MTTTIGTHSRGHPRIKQTIRMPITNTQGGMLKDKSVSAMNLGVPMEEKTAPMNVEAARRIITMLVVSAVRKAESLMSLKVSRLLAAVTATAPRQPRAAPSVGVASPEIMLPSASRIRVATGMIPKKNSRQT